MVGLIRKTIGGVILPQKAAYVHILGHVQGVGFRWQTMLLARSLNVDGWIRNCMDGSVECFIQGEENSVNKMLQWFRGGPARAKVEALEISWLETDHEIKGFNIL